MKKIFVALTLSMVLAIMPGIVSAGYSYGDYDIRNKLEVARAEDQTTWANFSAETNSGGQTMLVNPGDVVYFRFKTWNVGEGDNNGGVTYDNIFTNPELFEYFDAFQSFGPEMLGYSPLEVATNPDEDGDEEAFVFFSEDFEAGQSSFYINTILGETSESSGYQSGIMEAKIADDATVGETILVTISVEEPPENAYNNFWQPRALADALSTTQVKLRVTDGQAGVLINAQGPMGDPSFGWETTTENCEVWSDYLHTDGDYLYSLCEYDDEWFITKRDAITGDLVPEFGEDGEVVSSPYSPYAYALKVDSSGIYIAGSSDYYWWLEKRDLTTGELIGDFGGTGHVSPESYGEIYDIALSDSAIYLVGYDEYYDDESDMWRIEKRDLTTGELIEDFGVDGMVTENISSGADVINSVALDDSGLYIGGFDSSPDDDGGGQWRIEKRNLTNGDLITDFGVDGVVEENVAIDYSDHIIEMALDSSGLYLVGRDMTDNDYQWRIEKRDLINGDLIEDFGVDGVIALNLSDEDYDEAVDVVLNDYHLYVVGQEHILGPSDTQLRLERRDLTTGALDADFGTAGVINYNPTEYNDRAYGVVLDNSGVYFSGMDEDDNGFIIKYAFPEDDTPPIFTDLPGINTAINLTNGQTITTNPYAIYVKASDNVEVDYVEFYVDGVLICTDNTADANGVYSCNWNTALYHSDIQVLAYDTAGNQSVALNRSVTVTLNNNGSLPNTGPSAWYYLLGLVPAMGIMIIRRRMANKA